MAVVRLDAAKKPWLRNAAQVARRVGEKRAARELERGLTRYGQTVELTSAEAQALAEAMPEDEIAQEMAARSKISEQRDSQRVKRLKEIQSGWPREADHPQVLTSWEAGEESGHSTSRSSTVASTTTPRPRRSSEDWEELAHELLPELQAGKRVSDLTDRIGSNDAAFRVALARIGYDDRGNPQELKPLTARTKKTLANKVAAAREQKEPWWSIIARSNLSYGELNQLLKEFGHKNGDAAA